MSLARAADHSIRAIVYNPMSLVRCGRQLHIEREFQRVDFTIMPGTRIPVPSATPTGAVMFGNDTHTVLDWGWSRDAQLSNRSTGIRLMLRNDLYKPKHCVQVLSPPKELQGRGGAVRL